MEIDVTVPATARAEPSFDLHSLDLVRQYFEQVAAASAPTTEVHSVDWTLIERSIAGAQTLEQAIGRAVLVIDRATRAAEPLGPLDDVESSHLDLGPFPPPVGTPKYVNRTPIRTVVRHVMAAHKVPTSIALSIVMILLAMTYAIGFNHRGTSPARYDAPQSQEISGNAQLTKDAAVTLSPTNLPATVTPPAPAPPSLTGAPALRPHEVFAFAPYWTLGQSAGFDVGHLSTIAYFSIGVNSDGSLAESGPGWDGYQSQDLANLVTRAHAANDRVVLTVDCFDQNALNQLTSSASAPTTLATALVAAIKAKNLDGVNLDFEGSGSADQAGLTSLVTQVASAVHGADPNYQVTMDTYASSAGDPNGFFDIKALAPVVDAFFVMEYQLNLQSGVSPQSPLTSTMFSDKTSIDQYAAAVPPAKVILGLPYFGLDWPTSDGTLTGQATGPATPLSYGQVLASGHPIYWDAITDTAWTSYQEGDQWHETFFENPTSLYDVTQLATASNLAGVGIWALGMDGNNAQMLSALLGLSPPTKPGAAGPVATSQSPATPAADSTTTTSGGIGTVTIPFIPSTTTTLPGAGTAASTTTTPDDGASTSSTSTTVAPYDYTGVWNGQSVTLSEGPAGTTPPPGTAAGQLTQFSTTDPATSCLSADVPLIVDEVDGSPDDYFVYITEPPNCADAYFTFTTS